MRCHPLGFYHSGVALCMRVECDLNWNVIVSHPSQMANISARQLLNLIESKCVGGPMSPCDSRTVIHVRIQMGWSLWERGAKQ